MDTPQIYYYRNDTLLELTITDEVTEAAIENATVEATVKTAAGVEVAGQSWPLSLSHVADGLYRGVLDAELDVAVGDNITVEVEIDGGSGRNNFFAVPVKVRQRGKVYY